jgi:hypothetical protein
MIDSARPLLAIVDDRGYGVAWTAAPAGPDHEQETTVFMMPPPTPVRNTEDLRNIAETDARIYRTKV